MNITPIILFIITLNLYAEKTVSIKLNNYKNDIKYKYTYENIENKTNYLQNEKGIKFFLKNEYPKGKQIKAKITKLKIINGKKEKTINYKNYRIYELLCIKENDVYFDCIERN